MVNTVLGFVLMVLTGALIGWGTNVIAIRMLFRPHNEIKILGLSVQGAIPRRRNEIAERIANTVALELVSISDITAKINSVNIETEVDSLVFNLVNVKLKEEIIAKFPMASLFINEALLAKIREYAKGVIMDKRHEITGAISSKLEQEIDIKEIVKEKIENFSLIQLETIVVSIAKNELREIEIMGGALGAAIGIIQFVITKVIL